MSATTPHAPDGYPARRARGAAAHRCARRRRRSWPNAPRTLRYAIGALDQLSRRMRALATADSAHATRPPPAARERRRDPAARAHKLEFRTPGWPAWILTPGHDEPRFDRGMLVLDERNVALAPAPSTSAYRTTIRDAYLLAGQPLPLDVDGRRQMALRHQRQLEPAQRPERPAIDELAAARARAPHRRADQPPTQNLARLPPSMAATPTPARRRASTRRHGRVPPTARRTPRPTQMTATSAREAPRPPEFDATRRPAEGPRATCRKAPDNRHRRKE